MDACQPPSRSMEVQSLPACTLSNCWLFTACASTSVLHRNHALVRLKKDCLERWKQSFSTTCSATPKHFESHGRIRVRLILNVMPSGLCQILQNGCSNGPTKN